MFVEAARSRCHDRLRIRKKRERELEFLAALLRAAGFVSPSAGLVKEFGVCFFGANLWCPWFSTPRVFRPSPSATDVSVGQQDAGCQVHAVGKDPFDCNAALNNFFRVPGK